MARYAPLWPILNWGLFALGAVYCISVIWGGFAYGDRPWIIGDAGAWYFIDTPYDWTDRPPDVAHFRYAPAFLWLTAPLRLLPVEIYVAVWFGLHLAALIWLRAPWMLALPFVADDVIRGNITIFLAVALVVAMRWPVAWSVMALTKVGPMAGIGWHFARREWSGVAWAVGGTLGVVAVGLLSDRSLWDEWFRSLTVSTATYEATHPLGPIWFRVLLTFGVSWYAGATNRAWLMAAALIIAVPGLWPYNLALLAAIPRLVAGPTVAIPIKPERVAIPINPYPIEQPEAIPRLVRR